MKTHNYLGLILLLFGLLAIAGCDNASYGGTTGNAVGNSPSGYDSAPTYPDAVSADSTGDDSYTTTANTTNNTADGGSDDAYDETKIDKDTTPSITTEEDETSDNSGAARTTAVIYNDNYGSDTSDDSEDSDNVRFEAFEVTATVANLGTQEVSQEVSDDYRTTTSDDMMTNDDDNAETTTRTTAKSTIIFKRANGETQVSGSEDDDMDVVGTIVIEDLMAECNTGGLMDDCETDLEENDRLDVYFPQGSECSDDDNTMFCDDGEFELEEGDTVRGALQIDTDDSGYRQNRFMISSIN